MFFTCLSQWSIGIVLCLTGLVLMPADGVVFAPTGLSPANPVFLALALIVLATALSFMHLGNPVNAPRTLNNLATSWLSREILGIGLFSFSVFVLFVYSWRTDEHGFPGYLLVPASLAGLFLLWTMTRVYLISTVPAWNSAHTPLGFTSTALCLGLVTCLVFNMMGHIEIDIRVSTYCSAILAAVLILEMVSGILRQQQLARMDTGFDGPRFDRGALHLLFLVRMGVLLTACLGIIFFVFQPGLLQGQGGSSWLYAVLLLAVLQEFVGRLLFYGSYFRVGL
jgi:DMSO reductase anchor subunit